MENNFYSRFGGVIVAIVLLGAVSFFIYRDVYAPEISSVPVVSTTTIRENGVTAIVKPGGHVTIEQVPIGKGDEPKIVMPIPNLNRPISFPSDFPEEAKKVLTENIHNLSAALKKDPASLDDWLNLGIERKIIADYEGARQAWEYAAKLYPGSPTPFANLGYLYGYYLHKPVEAEADYRKALVLDPDKLTLYRSVFEFYRDVIQDYDKARGIVSDGLKRLPWSTTEFDKMLATLPR